MVRMKRRVLNAAEQEEARRLMSAWVAYKQAHHGATQTWLAAEAGLGTQGAVGQYLRGVIPLNIEALLAISRVLDVDPRLISPRLTNIVEDLLPREAYHFPDNQDYLVEGKYFYGEEGAKRGDPSRQPIPMDPKLEEWLRLRENLGSDDIAEFTAMIRARQERNLRLIEELENSLHPKHQHKSRSASVERGPDETSGKKQSSQSS